MKNAIKEYLGYSGEEKKDLWENATFVFDTNVFLNLYRYTARTREILLSAFDNMQDRLWMPNHVAHEFMKNRSKIIIETNNQYESLQKEADKFLEHCKTALYLESDDKDYVEIHTQLKNWLKTVKEKNIAVNNPDSDLILEKILSLFEGKVGDPFSESEMAVIENEGRERFSKEIPPGYKDSNKQKDKNLNNVFGDYIVWKQILDFAKQKKKDIVLVTNDQKDDWWFNIHGKTLGPRIELKREFYKLTEKRFYMYSMRSFVTLFESGKNNAIDRKTIDEIEFFSKVIRHKTPRSDLKKYYKSFDNRTEARAAKIRYEIMNLERKNKKRKNTIECHKRHYIEGEMPEGIKTLVDNNINNYNRDSKRIEELLLELETISDK